MELSTLQEDADKQRMKKSKPGYGAEEEAAAEAAVEARANQENLGDSQNTAAGAADEDLNEGIGGMSKKNFLMAVDNDENAAQN